jgi:hypothetical protein
MSYAIDHEYINRINYRLENFKWKSPNLANFRCPICGDSSKKKNKSRGYFYIKGNHFSFLCHNCGYSSTFQTFLKDFDQDVYTQYIIDKLKDEQNVTKKTTINKKPKPETIFGNKYGLIHVSELEYTHPARMYLRSRQIPSNDAYYVDNFFAWGAKNFPQKFKETIKDHCRIIFPAYDQNRNIIGYSCRSINGEEPKYYTLKLVEDFVFGLNRIDKSKPVYIVEGGIDSLFLPNCVAACTSSLHRVKGLDDCKKILVPDNQNRNKEIVKLIGKFIDEDFMVVLWPEHVKEKDINDMILAGYSRDKILEIINSNTFQGLEAKIRFNNWRKV